MEKTKIADNPYYSIYISPEKNRAYLKIKGFWRSAETVPDYLNDWKKALSRLKKGLTLLTDASEMKTHPADVKKLHEQAQGLVLKMEVKKVAEIIKDDVTEMQLDAVAKSTQFPKKNFKSVDEADTWLND